MDFLLAYRGKADPETMIALFAILCMIGGAFAIWFGFNRLKQAKKIARHFTLKNLKDHLGELVTVYGTPEPLEEIFGPARQRVLWLEKLRQRYERHGRSGSWRTVHRDTKATDFHLVFEDGGKVLIRCKPKEVQRMSTKVTGGDMFSSSRTVVNWLPIYRHLTVTGRLELKDSGANILPQRGFGMFMSPHPPGKAAGIEFAKAWTGLIGGTVILVGGVVALAVMIAML